MKPEPYTPTAADFSEARQAIGAPPKPPAPLESLIAELKSLADGHGKWAIQATVTADRIRAAGKAAAYFDAARRLESLMPAERTETAPESLQISREGKDSGQNSDAPETP